MPSWLAESWPLGVLGAVLVIAAVGDVRTGKIYNWITYPAIAMALIAHALTGGLTGGVGLRIGLSGALAGLAAGFLPLLLAWLAGGIGGGDAKLMAAVGALTGWQFALTAMFYGFLVAAVMALAVMVYKRTTRQTMKRIGRFLLLLLTPSRPSSPATADSPKIPFGLALCIGSALALGALIWRGRAHVFWPGI